MLYQLEIVFLPSLQVMGFMVFFTFVNFQESQPENPSVNVPCVAVNPLPSDLIDPNYGALNLMFPYKEYYGA